VHECKIMMHAHVPISKKSTYLYVIYTYCYVALFLHIRTPWQASQPGVPP
jgi:hypothetical protein